MGRVGGDEGAILGSRSPRSYNFRLIPSQINKANIAVVVSVLAALFSGGQWWESRQARLNQTKTNAETQAEQRRQRQLSEAQVMTAERAMIMADRQLRGWKSNQPETDLPKIMADVTGALLPDVIRLGDMNNVRDFWGKADKTVNVANNGKSTAYDFTCRLEGSLNDPGDRLGILQVKSGSEPEMLMRDGNVDIPISEKSMIKNAASFDNFSQGTKNYYIFGGCSYRDAFSREYLEEICWEIKAEKDHGLKRRACRSPKQIDDAIDKEEKDSAQAGWK